MRVFVQTLTWGYLATGLAFLKLYQLTRRDWLLKMAAPNLMKASVRAEVRSDLLRALSQFYVGELGFTIFRSLGEPDILLFAANYYEDASRSLRLLERVQTNRFATALYMMAFAKILRSILVEHNDDALKSASQALETAAETWTLKKERDRWCDAMFLNHYCLEERQLHQQAQEVGEEVLGRVSPSESWHSWFLANHLVAKSLMAQYGLADGSRSRITVRLRALLDSVSAELKRPGKVQNAIADIGSHAVFYAEVYLKTGDHHFIERASELASQLAQTGTEQSEQGMPPDIYIAQVNLIKGMAEDDLTAVNRSIELFEKASASMSEQSPIPVGDAYIGNAAALIARSRLNGSIPDLARASDLLAKGDPEFRVRRKANFIAKLQYTLSETAQLNHRGPKPTEDAPNSELDTAEKLLSDAATDLEQGDGDKALALLHQSMGLLMQHTITLGPELLKTNEIRIELLKARAMVMLAHLQPSEDRFEEAASYLDSVTSGIDSTRNRRAWLQNRILKTRLIASWNKYSESAGRHLQALRTYDEILAVVRWDLQPLQWLEIASKRVFYMCDIIRAGNIGGEKLERMAAVEMSMILDRGRILVDAAATSSERQAALEALSGIGEELAILNLRAGDVSVALKVVDETRAVTTTQSFLESRMDTDLRRKVRSARLAWQQAARSEQEASESTLGLRDLPAEENQASNANVHTLHDETRETFESYKILFDKHIGQTDQSWTLDDVAARLEMDARIAVFVISRIGSAVICLSRPGVTLRLEAEVVWLDGVMPDELNDLIYGQQGYLDSHSGFRKVTTAPDSAERVFADWSRMLDTVARQVGASIMQPLCSALNVNEHVSELKCVVSSKLAAIPLHASLVRSQDVDGEDERVLERFAVSYWPNVSALARIADVSQPTDRDPTEDSNCSSGAILRVAGENTPGLVLPSPVVVASEAAGVVSGLRTHRYSAFFCHGFFDPERPFESGIVLPDETVLSIGEVSEAHFGESRLAFIASCESGMPSTRYTRDEFVSLPTSFMQAGFPCIVSNLWLTQAEAASAIATRFFELHITRELRPALAMRQTLLEMAGLIKPDQHSSVTAIDRFSDPVYWSGFTVTGG